MSQQIQINYGAAPNDGTGDPLRTAFIKTDENFDNIWLAGPVGSNVTIANNTISVVDTNGNLILSPNGIGAIQTNSRLAPRTTLTYDIGSQALRYRNVYAVGVDVANAVLGNLSNINITVANLHVLGGTDGYVLQTDGTGNLTWAAGGGSGNGEVGGVNTQVQFNNAGSFGGQAGFTFDKTSNLLSVPGNITTTGNVSGNYFLGNGSQLTGLAATYGNANVVANLAALGTNPISTSGNITGGNILGGANVNATTHTGTTVSVSANITGGNILTAGIVSATGNITGNYFIGNGRQLTGITGNVTFSGEAVIGTGTSNIQSGLYLAPDPVSLANDLYLRVRGNIQDEPTHIHFDTGNNQYYNQFIGDDNKYIQLANTGNIVINTNNYAGNTAQWTFGTDGTTTFPTLTVDLHNGGNQSAQTLQFGKPGQQAIITGPTPEENNAAERIIIQGQRGNGTGEGGDVYVWGGDADTNGGDIKIYAGDADNVSAGSGGYVNIAGGDGFDNGGAINIDGGSSANGTGGYVDVSGGSGELDGGSASLQGGYGATGQGGVVQITGGGSGNGTGSFGNVVLGSGSSGWIFDNTGNLTLPDNTFAVNYANGTPVSIGGGAAGLPLANGTSNINIATANGNVTVTANATTWTFGSDSKITLPNGASLNDTSGDSVAFGQNAGLTSQDQHAVAIGRDAGSLYQGEDSIAIGYQAGYHDQQRGVAIGYQAGVGGTLYRSVSDAQGGSGPVHNYVSGDGNPILTLDSVVDVNANDKIFGNNIPAGAYVVSINDPDINISAPPTAALTAGDAITFVGVVIGINDASNIVYPMRVTGTNIPTNTFVQSTGCSVVTLSQYPTAPLINGAGLLFNIGQGAYSTAVGYRAGETFQADGAVAIGYVAGYQNQSTKAVAVGQFAGYQNQSANAVAVGTNAGEFTQSINAVAVGYKAGYYQQGARAVAIGEDAGYNIQGEDAVAVGQKAGFSSQGDFAVAIGNRAGTSVQGEQAVAIGYGTGLVSQGYSAVAIGANAASYAQGSSAVAIGELAGNTSQGGDSIAVGYRAGLYNQLPAAVAIGYAAGQNFQGTQAVAIGDSAGQAGSTFGILYQSGSGTEITIFPNADIKIGQRITGEFVPDDTFVANIDETGEFLDLSQAITGTPAVDTEWIAWQPQGTAAVAIGAYAGRNLQGDSAVAVGDHSGYQGQGINAVAVGYNAGYNTQGARAVAIGQGTGHETQGEDAVAIGSFAGQSAQGNNSIILNATGANLNQTTANTFTVAPIRASTTGYSLDTGNVLYYNTSTHEITTAPPNSIAGDPYAAVASDTSNVTVWTANSDQVVGAKLTVRVVYHSGGWQNTELLDITAAKTYPAGTPAFTVSNRVKTNPAYQNVPIDVTLTGGNVMQVISSAPDGVGNSVYWTYSVTSFNQTFD